MHLNKVTLHPQDYPGVDKYPFNLAIFHKTEAISFSTPVTLFAGENGTGKSTLLRAICRTCGIHIWEDTERLRYNSNAFEDDLYKYIDVEWSNGSVPGSFFGSEIFHDFARFLDGWARATPAVLDYFGGSSLLSQSHGQSFISFFSAIYRVKGLHFLDEPETALSPRSQLELLRVLKKASQSGTAQFLIATHSPILLACPGAIIHSFDTVPVAPVSYEDTEYYRVYHDFLNDRNKYLEGL